MRRQPDAPLELYGETAPDVRRVVLRFRLPGNRRGRQGAVLLRGRDLSLLRGAGIRPPFGYFVAEVPPRASRVEAVALDRASAEIGRLGFDRLARHMRPTVFISAPD